MEAKMSMFEFLKPPMFTDPEKIYLPLPKFSHPGSASLEQEVNDAIAMLNLKARDFSSSKNFNGEYMELIAQAEALAKKNHGVEAHKAVWEATACINRALETQDSGKFLKCVGCYLALWLLILGYAGWWLKNCEGPGASEVFFGFSYWRYLVMGALGGIIVSIWGLTKHSVDLDFDRHFSVWYWFKPVLGAVMGLVVVVTAQAGLFAIQGQTSVQPSSNGKMVLYVLAFLAGFSERFFLGIIDRIMTAMLNSGQSPSSPSNSGAAKGSASGSGN
jgi:hypothetical protein